MNYQKIYQNLIENRKQNILESYVETHHIIPKCLGGTDRKENLVKLTAREHFVAHQLLIKIYPTSKKLIYAVQMMSNNKQYGSKKYAWLKELRSNIPTSKETRKKISESIMNHKVSLETRNKMSKSKQNMTKETKKKMSESKTGDKNYFYNKHHSDESKIKMRNPRSEEAKHNMHKPKSTEHIRKIAETKLKKKLERLALI
jgi:rRNA maturation endonuclease Nob1